MILRKFGGHCNSSTSIPHSLILVYRIQCVLSREDEFNCGVYGISGVLLLIVKFLTLWPKGNCFLVWRPNGPLSWSWWSGRGLAQLWLPKSQHFVPGKVSSRPSWTPPMTSTSWRRRRVGVSRRACRRIRTWFTWPMTSSRSCPRYAVPAEGPLCRALIMVKEGRDLCSYLPLRSRPQCFFLQLK